MKLGLIRDSAKNFQGPEGNYLKDLERFRDVIFILCSNLHEYESVKERRGSMPELLDMINIGQEMAKKLTCVGIDSPDKLIEMGAEQAFLKLKEKYPKVCLVHLYALEGAIHNIEFNSLSEIKKKELKEFSDFLKK